MPMQVSWIDADEVGALLGRLRDTPPAAASTELANHEAPALLVADFEPVQAEAPEPSANVPQTPVETSSDSHHDLDLFRARLQAIRERAMNAGLLPGDAPAPQAVEPDSLPAHEEEEEMAGELPIEGTPPGSDEAPSWTPYQPSGSSVNERLEGFAAWARPLMNGSSLFVIDDQGDLLWGRSSHQELVVTTVMAWVAFSRMSGVLAFERVPLLHQRMATGDHLTALPCPTRLGLLHIAITGDHAVADEHVPELRQALIAAMEAS